MDIIDRYQISASRSLLNLGVLSEEKKLFTPLISFVV